MTDAKDVFEWVTDLADASERQPDDAPDDPGTHPAVDYKEILVEPENDPAGLAIIPDGYSEDEITTKWVSATGRESFVSLAEYR